MLMLTYTTNFPKIFHNLFFQQGLGYDKTSVHLLINITFNSNSGDREKVLTYGAGPRQCVGKNLAQKLFRVCIT